VNGLNRRLYQTTPANHLPGFVFSAEQLMSMYVEGSDMPLFILDMSNIDTV